MPGYQVKIETVTVGGTDYAIRSLLDSNQHFDPDGEAARAGISPASWPLFGQLWPSARVLAKIMDEQDLAGKRILEIGAGLALASLVIHQRSGDVTVSDLHPMSRSFLDENLRLNHLGPLKYETGNWANTNPALGIFDLIIGSDVLYERIHPAMVAGFVSRHAAPDVEVIIVDPDRGNRPQFRREMQGFGFAHSESRAGSVLENGGSYKGCILRFSRSAGITLS